jgi:hypothetical protein
MLEIEIKEPRLTLGVNVSNGNHQGPLAITPSDSIAADELRKQLDRSSGPFGHGLNTRFIAPIDLHYALEQLGYEFEVTIGSEIVESYDPEIPEGAVT